MIDRAPSAVLISIAVNLVVGLSPALILRLLVYKRPVEWWTSFWWAVGVLVGLIILSVLMSKRDPNSFAIFVYTYLTFQALHFGYNSNDSTSDTQ